MASALFQLSADGGATFLPAGVALAGPNALASAGSGSYSLRAQLDSTAGVGPVVWTLTSADDITLGGGPLPAVPTAPDKSGSFSIPKTPATYLLRAVVNGGVDKSTDGSSASLSQVLAIKVKTAGGLELVAVGERTEGNAQSGWLSTLNALVRGGGGGGGGGVSPGSAGQSFVTNAAGVVAWGGPGTVPVASLTPSIPAAGATVDVSVYAVPSSPAGSSRFVVTEFIVAVRAAITGSGSLAISAGTTTGNTDILPVQTLTSATAAGTLFGITAAQKGSAFDPTLLNKALLSAATLITFRISTTGSVGSPVLQVYLFGYYLN